MGNLVPAGKTEELADGAMKEALVEGREILLARVGDRYYAADNRCTHMGGNLSQGRLEGTVVTCPRHGSQFDLTDGHVVRWLDPSARLSSILRLFKSAQPINTYPVKVEHDSILVEIQPPAGNGGKK